MTRDVNGAWLALGVAGAAAAGAALGRKGSSSKASYKIYDAGPKSGMDRYTIVNLTPLEGRLGRRWEFLGFGPGVSEHGELKEPPGRHLGKSVSLEDLPDGMQAHAKRFIRGMEEALSLGSRATYTSAEAEAEAFLGESKTHFLAYLPYVMSKTYTLGGPGRPSVALAVSLDPKTSWPNGIYENSRHAKFMLNWPERTIEQLTGSGLDGRFRKSKFKDVQDALRKIDAFLKKQGGAGSMVRKQDVNWRWLTYDVWGNQKDGYDVNDVRDSGSIKLPEEPTLSECLSALRDYGHLSSKATTKTISEGPFGDADTVELQEKKTGKPIGRLERSR